MKKKLIKRIKRKSFKKKIKNQKNELEKTVEQEDKRLEFLAQLQVQNKIKYDNYNKRKEAQEIEKQRKQERLRTIAKMEEQVKEQEKNEKEIQEFFDSVKIKAQCLEKEAQKANEDNKANKADKDNKSNKTNRDNKANKSTRNKQNKRITGSSMKEILSSEEFQKMWQEGEER